MAQMDYFRRPVLVGKSVTRQTFGTVRGNIRRNDADGFVAVPYFPGVTLGQQLLLGIDDVLPITVTLATAPAGGMASTLADINAALGLNGTAFDADGCIGIRTNTLGSAGSIVVLGGSASSALGFDLTVTTLYDWYSRGGEVPSTPEDRIGNTFGTKFPTRGENFGVESMTRALHSISTNSDVHHSDIVRDDVVVKKMAYSTADRVQLNIGNPSLTRVWVGLGELNRLSQKEELAPYFYLIDTATGLPAKSRVVGLTRGTVVGLPPYADATAWSGAGVDGNILGVDLAITAAIPITRIFGGRTIVCSTANFADVSVGDFVNITGATNLTPWSNNGYRWAVEAVINTTTLTLRPLSQVELALLGVTSSEVQPIVELNSEKSGLEIYGSATVHSGAFCHNSGSGIRVIVDPPIPVGATYDLYVAHAGSLRGSKIHDRQNSTNGPARELVSDIDPTDNWTLYGLDPTLSGGNCAVTAGYIRWHGRGYHLPAQTFLPGAFLNGTSYVYWSETTGNLAITQVIANWAGVLDDSFMSPTSKGHPIAEVIVAGGVITAVNRMTRRREEKAITVTVGDGAQFRTIPDAMRYINAFATNIGETSSASGAYPHFEVVLFNDQTLTEDVVVNVPGLSIRGVSPRVLLTCGSFRFVASGVTKFLSIKDLSVSSSAVSFVNLTTTALAEKVLIQNVRHLSGALSQVVTSTGTGSTSSVSILDSKFTCSVGVIAANGSTTFGVDYVNVERCTFGYSLGVAPHLFTPQVTATTWAGISLTVKDTDFTGSWGGASAGADIQPMFIHASQTRLLIQNVNISIGNYSSAVNNVLIDTNFQTLLDNVVVTDGKIATAVRGSSNYVTALNCSFRISSPSGSFGLAAKAIGCTITKVDVDLQAHGNGTAIISQHVENCILNGPWDVSIRFSSASTRIVGNIVNMFSLANSTARLGIWNAGVSGPDSVIADNVIDMPETVVGDQTAIYVDSTSGLVVSNNLIHMAAPGLSVGAVSRTGIYTSCSGSTFSGNNIISYGGVYQAAPAQNVTGFSIQAAATECVFSGNTLQLAGAGSQVWNAILITGTPAFLHFVGNYVDVQGHPFNGAAPSNGWVVDGNSFNTSVASPAGDSTGFIGTTVGNSFGGSATANVTGIAGRFESNYVKGSVVVSGSTTLEFIGNTVDGNFDGSTGTPTFISAHVIGNTFNAAGSGTITINSAAHIWTLDSNYAAGAINITCAEAEMTNNRFGGAVTITLSGGGFISSCFFGNSVITMTSGSVSASYLGPATLTLGTGSAYACTIGGGLGTSSNIISGQVSGCYFNVYRLNLGNNTVASPISFVGNYVATGSDSGFGNGLHINAGTGQPVSVVGNNIKPQTFANTDISSVYVDRGDGVIISGNTIFGAGTVVDVGTAAAVSDIIVSGNYLIGQSADMSVASRTLTAVELAGGLAAGTYSYVAIGVMSDSGLAGNRKYYSVSALSNPVTLAAPSGITLTLAPYPITAPIGLTLIGVELWRTNDGGATWVQLTVTTFNGFGVANDTGEVGAGGTPILTTTKNNTGDRPVVRFFNSVHSRCLGNLMSKAIIVGDDVSFILMTANGNGTLIGDNHFTSIVNGTCDDGNAGTNENDTFWTSPAVIVLSEAGSLASGGTRRV